jgi:hypothetical protein
VEVCQLMPDVDTIQLAIQYAAKIKRYSFCSSLSSQDCHSNFSQFFLLLSHLFLLKLFFLICISLIQCVNF